MLGAAPPKLITTLHGTDITLVGQDRTFFEITRFGIERSDGVTAVSEFLKKMTVEEFEISKPIQVIPNFVDLSSFCRTRGYRERSAFAAARPEDPPPRLELPAREARRWTWCASSSA